MSVVIAAYNHADFLVEAVESALAQTLGRPEVIIVDDGSTDATSIIGRTLDATLVRRENGGPSAARNTGLHMASGRFIVFLDADDKLHPRHNEACLDALRARPDATYAYTQWQCFGASNDVSHHPSFDSAELLNRNYIHAASLFPTHVLRRIPWDERFRRGMEDWDLFLSLLACGHHGVLVDEPLLLYRQRDHGRTAALRQHRLRLQAVHVQLLLKHRRLYGTAFKSRSDIVTEWVRAETLGVLEERGRSVRRRLRRML